MFHGGDRIKTSRKISTSLLTAFTILSMISPMAVAAKSTATATSSGSTSGNEMNTISSSTCTGTNQLSGIDAEVFKLIKPDHSGTVVCAKSNGFKTVATGTNKVNSYHWTAWYKNNLEDDVDRTQDTGNYYGFDKTKVQDWKRYEANIRKLNGGRFPETKNYTYPTDTTDGKLSFWGDVAGYYSILGDPQYANIHLEAYQQFSYRVENTYVTESYGYNKNYCTENPSQCAPKEEPSGNTPSNEPSSNGGNKHNAIINSPNTGVITPPPTTDKTTYCDYSNPTNYCMIHCTGQACKGMNSNPSWKNSQGNNTSNPLQSYFTQGNTSGVTNGMNSGNPCNGPICYDTQSSTKRYYLLDANGYATGRYVDKTTHVERYNETKDVKIADAYVGANAYATEIAAYGRISLQPGSKGTLTYDVAHDKFWKVTPSYWVDGGKETISNDSSYPYHFASEGVEGAGQNNVNLYAVISKRDKLYNLVHGYPDITDTNVPDKNGYPGSTPETCIEVNGKKTCSKNKTPVINVEIDIDSDEAQSQVEIDRFVHLTKDKK